MNYELSPYPQALFVAKQVLRKADKAQLMNALIAHVTAISDAAFLETHPEAEHNVLNGGSLLRRQKWSDGRTYTSIADDYASFTVKHYGKATVVFNSYSGGPSKKDNTHHRHRQNCEDHNVNITETMKFPGKMEDFLSNYESKQALILLFADHMKIKGSHVMHAERNADLDIVRTSVLMSSEKIYLAHWRGHGFVSATASLRISE